MKPLTSRGQRRLTFVLGMGITAVVLLLVYAIVVAAISASETNARGEKRESQVERNDQTLAILKDCTEPGGKCYRRSLQQTAGVVSDLSRVVVLTAACGGELPYGLTTDERVAALTECVTERLSEPPKRRSDR